MSKNTTDFYYENHAKEMRRAEKAEAVLREIRELFPYEAKLPITAKILEVIDKYFKEKNN